MTKKTLENFLIVREALNKLRVPSEYFVGAREFVLQQIKASHQDLIRRPEGAPEEVYLDNTLENLELFRKLTNEYISTREQEKEQFRPMKRRKQRQTPEKAVEETPKIAQKEDEVPLITIPQVMSGLKMHMKYVPTAKDYVAQNMKKNHPEIAAQFITRWKTLCFPNTPENLSLVQTYLTRFEASQIKKVVDKYKEKSTKPTPEARKEDLIQNPPIKPADTLTAAEVTFYSRRHLTDKDKIPLEFISKYHPMMSVKGETYFTEGQRETITLEFKKSLETLAKPDSNSTP